MDEYTENYKENLILYWQQYHPGWTIPGGYHVHHIKPKCTFEDPNDPRIHHPRNLIALHVDDHATIHKCRGDRLVSCLIWSMKDRVVSDATKEKMAQTHKTRKRKPLSPKHKQQLSKANIGKSRPHTAETKVKMKESAKNRPPVTEETRRKNGAFTKGKTWKLINGKRVWFEK